MKNISQRVEQSARGVHAASIHGLRRVIYPQRAVVLMGDEAGQSPRSSTKPTNSLL
jgi:hypothetical protein